MELKRHLGLLHVFCIASGAMISSGIFVLPGLAYAKAGPAVILSYLLAGILAATGLLSTAELATAMPKAGSDYFFITRGMGAAVGTVAGVLNWVSFSLKSAFAIVGMAALVRIWAPIDMRFTGVLLGVAFVVINIIGVKEAARLQVVLVLGLLALMFLYVVIGLPDVNIQHYEPFAPSGFGSVFSTAGFVFISYGGLLKVASVAEEVRNPGRTIPVGMILSLVVVSFCYALMIFVTVGILRSEQLVNTLTPITDSAVVFMGSAGGIVLAVAASLAFLTTANAGVLAGSRYLLAMSRDGMLPQSIRKIGTRFHTPHAAILVTGGLVIVPVFIDLHILVETASLGLILTNIFSILSVIVLRESMLQNYRPTFRAPFYPWLQIVGFLGFSFVLLEMREEAFLLSAMLITIGFCIYWFYGRPRVKSESALLHLLQRLTARELTTGTLETELKDIIRGRDAIVPDRFDMMVEKCPVLDLADAISRDAFFEKISDIMASRVGITPEEFYNLLITREEESSTVLDDDLAIPHIIVEGNAPMEMLIARCKFGIHFSSQAPAVHVVVMLAGPRREGNLHLQCLAAIAQIVRSPDFDSRWRTARGEQALRDIFLLGERRRE
ncbi:amino acid permease [Candidatus Omnitrophota bacterium]